MLVTLCDVRKSYASAAGTTAILQGVDLEIAAGDSVALTGESGSGKSTLLHLIGGLDVADSGTVQLDGQLVSQLGDAGLAALRRTTVGVVFQQFNLIPSLTVADNIAFQARLAGRYDAKRIATLVTRMGLASHLGKYPETLSGGQQQRAAIARVLATAPKLILADEPTGNLDEASAAVVLDLMLELVAETDAALLLVTHSQHLAARMGRQKHLQGGKLQ
jgi:putative ABC transport system ATP-binding protein